MENLEGLKGDIVSGPLPILQGDTGDSHEGYFRGEDILQNDLRISEESRSDKNGIKM